MRKLAATLLALVVAACSSPQASMSPSPALPSAAATGGASASPTSEPGATASPPATTAPSTQPPVGTLQVFPPGAAVEVSVKELNLRRRPSTGAKRVELLSRGDLLIVSPIDDFDFGYGPVKANGYTWYPVVKVQVKGPDGKLPALPTFPLMLGTEQVSGWAASDDGTQPFLAAVAPRCPTTVDLANVEGMLPAERLACFGAPIVLEGTFGCAGCGGVNLSVFKPRWLIDPLTGSLLSVDVPVRFGPTHLRFPPDGPAQPAEGTIIRATVHIDDARSTNCSITQADETGSPTIKVDARTAVLYCRERLVVESYEVLGIDPDFPG